MPSDDGKNKDNDSQDNHGDEDEANGAMSPSESDGDTDANDGDRDGDTAQDDQRTDDLPEDNPDEEQAPDSADGQVGPADSDDAEAEQRYPASDHSTGDGDDAGAGVSEGPQDTDDGTAAPDDERATLSDDNAAPDDNNTAPDDDNNSPENIQAVLDVRLADHGHSSDDSPTSNGPGNTYDSQSEREPQGASDQYHAQGYPISATVGQQPAQRTSGASKNVDGGNDTHAPQSHNLLEDTVSQFGTAIQSGVIKGITNSVAQATEGFIKKHLSGPLHLHSNKPTVPPAKPASTSHTLRPPATGSAGMKARPAQAHSAPAGSSATRDPVPQSGGPKPITGARPGVPPAASKARPSPASPQNGSPAHPSTQVGGDGSGGAKWDSVAAGTVKRSAGAEAQRPAGRGD